MKDMKFVCKYCGREGAVTRMNGSFLFPPPGWTAIGGSVVCDSKVCEAKELAAIRARQQLSP
jgi:hypothetical protein